MKKLEEATGIKTITAKREARWAAQIGGDPLELRQATVELYAAGLAGTTAESVLLRNPLAFLVGHSPSLFHRAL